jgi:flagellar basal-body rod protein FlgF
MDRLIYTALSDMGARARAQAVTANNLANIETIGFRRELIAAEGRYLGPGQGFGPAAIARAQSGAPSISTPMAHGRLVSTGRPLDVALAGEAWLAVRAADGTEAYTRRGDLALDAAGRLTTGDGRPLLDPEGRDIILPPGVQPSLAPDGTLSAQIPGDAEPQILGRLKLVEGGPRETGFDKRPDGLFASATPLAPSPSARLVSGTLETANLEATQAMVELVEQVRAFEASSRLLRTARELDEAGARLIRQEP